MSCRCLTVHGFVIHLRIVDRDVDLHAAVVHAAETLGELRLIRQRRPMMSSHPLSRRLLVSTTSVSPSHLPVEYPCTTAADLLSGERPAVGEDLTDAGAGLVEDHDESRRLDELPRHALRVKLHDAHGQAVRFGIVLAVAGHALLQQLGTVRRQRQAVLERRPDVAERGQRKTGRGHRRRLTPLSGRRAAPDAVEIRPAVRRSGRRRGEVDLAVRQPRHRVARVRRPLREEHRRQNGADGHGACGLDQGVHVQSPACQGIMLAAHRGGAA